MTEGDTRGASVRQRCVLVLPSSGEFDSRTHRIATSLLARGHEVTVLARLTAGLATEEMAPGGYRILRVPASSADGLPVPWLFSGAGRLIGLARRVVRRTVRRVRRRPAPVRPAQTAEALPTGPDTDVENTPAPVPARRTSMTHRIWTELIRRLAIPLTIRSHIKNARSIAPAADLYHGMAYMGIPIALDLGKRHHAPVVYDARDIYLEARNLAKMRGPARWLLARMERGWAHKANRVVTVNRAYAEVMAERLRVEMPLIVMNCSYRFVPPEPRERRFHEALGLDPGINVVLYHGGLFPDRGIEQLMAAMTTVDGAVLVLMGYGRLEPELRVRVAEPDFAGRVRLMPAVPPADLHAWVACADVVAMPIQPSTLNHRLTTPNKLFEAMAAGVPVVASDLPGMAAIVREVGCGVLVDPTDPVAIAAGIRSILDDPDGRAAMAARALEASRTTYTWERQMAVLLDEYSRLTGRQW